MRLNSEDCQPQVEWADKDDGSSERVLRDSLLKHKVLNKKQRKGGQGKKEPDVEVQCQVTYVEVPWFYPVNVRAPTASTKDVVKHNVQRHAYQLSIEERVDESLQGENGKGPRRALQYQSAQALHDSTCNTAYNDVFQDEWQGKSTGKGPAKSTADGKPRNTLGSSNGSSVPVHEGCESEHCKVHGKSGRKIGRSGVVHARADDHDYHEEYCYALLERPSDSRVHASLAYGAEDGQHRSQEVELDHLGHAQT